MSEVRRDSKGRKLLNGESQRKDGKYEYKYVDAFGKRRTIYSWKLTPSDRVPAGKRNDLSLREKSKEAERTKDVGIVPNGGNLTVRELIAKYLSTKVGIRQSSKNAYAFICRLIERYPVSNMRIDKIRIADAKAWFIRLHADGISYKTISLVRSLVKLSFQMAVDDDLLMKNPFSFNLSSLLSNDGVPRVALTPEQEDDFLRFIQNDSYYYVYYDAIYILFNTGLRISELSGLTKKDLDFKNNKIIVDHQLLRGCDMVYKVGKPKSSKGCREIPMTPDVKRSFQHILSTRKQPKKEPMVDGYSGFLFLDRNGNPMFSQSWQRIFRRCRQSYNKTYAIQMPNISPHVCRHTFCSKMAKAGMNPKMLQYIMGHSNITTTLNTYTHVGYEDAAEEMLRIMDTASKTPADPGTSHAIHAV